MAAMTNTPPGDGDGDVDAWTTPDGIDCTIRDDGPVLSARIRLPDNLVHAWENLAEAAIALSLATRRHMRCELVDGPPVNPQWLGIGFKEKLAASARKNPLSRDRLHQLLFHDAEIVATAVAGASEWAGQGRSVRPVRDLTYGPEKVRELMVRVGAVQSNAEVMLRPGQSAWNPARPYAPFTGKPEAATVIRYELTLDGVTASDLT